MYLSRSGDGNNNEEPSKDEEHKDDIDNNVEQDIVEMEASGGVYRARSLQEGNSQMERDGRRPNDLRHHTSDYRMACMIKELVLCSWQHPWP